MGSEKAGAGPRFAVFRPVQGTPRKVWPSNVWGERGRLLERRAADVHAGAPSDQTRGAGTATARSGTDLDKPGIANILSYLATICMFRPTNR